MRQSQHPRRSVDGTFSKFYKKFSNAIIVCKTFARMTNSTGLHDKMVVSQLEIVNFPLATHVTYIVIAKTTRQSENLNHLPDMQLTVFAKKLYAKKLRCKIVYKKIACKIFMRRRLERSRMPQCLILLNTKSIQTSDTIGLLRRFRKQER